jgi:hypothetical protein
MALTRSPSLPARRLERAAVPVYRWAAIQHRDKEGCMPGYAEFHNWLERAVQDSNGEQIGHADGIYADSRTGEPTFLLVKGGLFGLHLHFVPLEGAQITGEDIKVAWDKDTISNAPKIAADDSLSSEEERRLFDHYGIHFGEEPADGTVLILQRWTFVG